MSPTVRCARSDGYQAHAVNRTARFANSILRKYGTNIPVFRLGRDLREGRSVERAK